MDQQCNEATPSDYYDQEAQPPQQQYEPEPVIEATQRWEYETDDILKKVRERFSGERWNERTEKWEKIDGKEALCNEKGVDFVMSYLECIMHRGIYLSNFSQDEVKTRLSDIMDEVIGEMGCRYKEFGIKEEAMSRFVLLIDTMLAGAIKKAQDDLERKHKHSVEQRKIVTQRVEEIASPKKSGGGIFG